MTDDELRDELMTMIVAGHETTATSLSWIFERILAQPEIRAKLAGRARARSWAAPTSSRRCCRASSTSTR